MLNNIAELTKWKAKRIAEEVGVSEETVRRYLSDKYKNPVKQQAVKIKEQKRVNQRLTESQPPVQPSTEKPQPIEIGFQTEPLKNVTARVTSTDHGEILKKAVEELAQASERAKNDTKGKNQEIIVFIRGFLSAKQLYCPDCKKSELE